MISVLYFDYKLCMVRASMEEMWMNPAPPPLSSDGRAGGMNGNQIDQNE